MTESHIYEKKLSDQVKLAMHKLMKHASAVEQGFLFFRNRMIFKAHYDEEGCDNLLKSMVINKENVLRYLGRKYIPTYNEHGAIFKDQSCIQKVKIMSDKTLYIHIKNSEPHKIITDTIHVMRLLKEKGFEFLYEIKFYIEQLKIAFQDVMLYNICLEEWGMKVPSVARVYQKQLEKKYQALERIVEIKKRSVKRKFLRWHVKRGRLSWGQLRKLIAMEDYSPTNVKLMCKQIREENREKGIPVDF